MLPRYEEKPGHNAATMPTLRVWWVMTQRGRPLISRDQLKSINVCTRTNEHTYRRLKGAADKVGMRFADWIRVRLLSAADVDLATPSI